MTEREVFEEIAKIIGFDLARETSGDYDSEETRLIWKGWKLRADAQNVAEARALTIRCQDIQKSMALPDSNKHQYLTDTYRQIQNDGWIEWGGGDCPVREGAIVDVRLRSGQVRSLVSADSFIWTHGYYHYLPKTDADIVAYRVIENDGREG